MKDLCDNPEIQRLWYQDLQRYQRLPPPRRVIMRARGERALSQSAHALLAGLQQGTHSPAEAHTLLRQWYQETRGTMQGCKVGWMMDYIRFAYDYFGTQ